MLCVCGLTASACVHEVCRSANTQNSWQARLRKEVCTCAGVFASGGEDQLIAVWDLERTGETSAAVAAGAAADEEQQPGLPHQLMFQHAGHRSQVPFSRQPKSALLAPSSRLPVSTPQLWEAG